MRGSLLGPEFSESEIRRALEAHGAVLEAKDGGAEGGRLGEGDGQPHTGAFGRRRGRRRAPEQKVRH